jgi:hypothetical protein
LSAVDNFEPSALEDDPFVRDLPVAVDQTFSVGEWEVGEASGVGLGVKMVVVAPAGGQVENILGACVAVDEIGLDPVVVGASRVARCAAANRHVRQAEPGR